MADTRDEDHGRTSLSFNVITTSLGLALGLAGGLLVLDGFGWRAVAAMFDREPLLAGTRS